MSWATVQDTLNITGVTVTEAKVTQAQFNVELFSGVTEEYQLRPRDLRHLKLAVAYQAAWLTGQIDVTTRTDVESFTQDEMSIKYANKEAAVLAPLARQAIKRLSWTGTRSVRIRRPADVATAGDPDTRFTTDEDPETVWHPGWGA
jgi:hypothetical protein